MTPLVILIIVVSTIQVALLFATVIIVRSLQQVATASAPVADHSADRAVQRPPRPQTRQQFEMHCLLDGKVRHVRHTLRDKPPLEFFYGGRSWVWSEVKDGVHQYSLKDAL